MSEDMFGSGVAFKWGEPGQGVGVGFKDAVIVEVLPKQQANEYNPKPDAPKVPAFWKDGSPKYQWPVKIFIPGANDPTIPGDNGVRTVFLTQSDGRFKKTREMCARVGRRSVTVGDVWSLVCVKEDMADRGRKTYDGNYRLGDASTLAIARAKSGEASEEIFAEQPAQSTPAVESGPSEAEKVAAQIAELQAQLAKTQQSANRPPHSSAAVGAGAANSGSEPMPF